MKLEELLTEMIEKIESTDEKWIQPFNNSFPMNYKTKTHYNGFNVLNLWFIAEKYEYKTNNFLTYNQVKELGGFVNQGETAHDVFYFQNLEIKDDETDELKKIPMLKTYKVFNIAQTSLKIEETEKAEIADIEEFIKKTNITIKHSNDGAFYVPSKDFIGIPSRDSFISSEHYYAVLFHELSHATGHKNRLDRDMSGTFGDDSYAKEELIAETARLFLQTYFQISSEEMKLQNAAYLKGWLKKENPRVLWKIFSEAQKAYDFLISFNRESKVAL